MPEDRFRIRFRPIRSSSEAEPSSEADTSLLDSNTFDLLPSSSSLSEFKLRSGSGDEEDADDDADEEEEDESVRIRFRFRLKYGRPMIDQIVD